MDVNHLRKSLESSDLWAGIHKKVRVERTLRCANYERSIASSSFTSARHSPRGWQRSFNGNGNDPIARVVRMVVGSPGWLRAHPGERARQRHVLWHRANRVERDLVRGVALE